MKTYTPPKREQDIVPLHAEQISIERRQAVTGRVRIQLRTETHEQVVDEPTTHERVEIERISIGRVVDAVPDVREEGDVTIIPVVEEILVVERRLVLKEEVRVRRIRTTQRHQETILLREQQASVERVGAEDAAAPVGTSNII